MIFSQQGVQAETYIESTTRLPRQNARVAGAMLFLSIFWALICLITVVMGEGGGAVFTAIGAIACFQFQRLSWRAAHAEVASERDRATQSAQRRAEQEAALDARIAEAKASGAFARFGTEEGRRE
ncbi:MAG: hypothetical protein HUJ24_06115 [Rhodobacteraceae bacterium]|nr:hypothetical protein [Paracoccaceae bacterium]